MQGYELNEKDIESAVRWLKIHDPENANPETAIELLEYMQVAAHELSHSQPENLEKYYKELKSKYK